MPGGRIWPALLVLSATAVAPLAAQSESECREVSIELGVAGAESARRACQNLANFLRVASPAVQNAAELITRPGARSPATVFSEREFQQHNPSAASLAGSLAQSDATSSVATTALASGSVAMVGSEAGSDALVALGLNPAVVFLTHGPSESLAKYSRLFDLSAFVPVTDVTSGAPDSSGLDYIGLRMRLNWFGIQAGDALWSKADSLIDGWLSQGGRDVQKILDLLRGAPDLEACARDLAQDAAPSATTEDCGGPLELGVDEDEARELGAQLDSIRASLDSDYFGADVRLDVGDPTLGAVDGASGTYLFAGLAYGRRLSGGTPGATSVGIRLRAGARHASLDDTSVSAMAFEGGAGLEISRALGEQQVSAAVGMDLRYGADPGATDAQLQTNFAVLRSSLVIPVTDANSVSIALGVPIDGDLSSYLSVTFNWSLLLPGD